MSEQPVLAETRPVEAGKAVELTEILMKISMKVI